MKKLAGIIRAIVIFYILVMTIVIPHELAHFYFLRAYSIPVQELSLGFGSKLLGTNVGGVDLSFRTIPVGGYVGIRDEVNLPLSKHMVVLASGGLANILLAILLRKRWQIGSEFMMFNGILNLLPVFPFTDGGKISFLILENIGVDTTISSFIVLFSGMVIIFLYIIKNINEG